MKYQIKPKELNDGLTVYYIEFCDKETGRYEGHSDYYDSESKAIEVAETIICRLDDFNTKNKAKIITCKNLQYTYEFNIPYF